MNDILAKLRESLERIGAPGLVDDIDQIEKDLEVEEKDADDEEAADTAGEDVLEEAPKKDTRLPEELHLQANKDIPGKLYALMEEVYELGADVRELAAVGYNFTANANSGSAGILERQVMMAVGIQAIVSDVTRKYKKGTNAALRKALRKARKDLMLMRDTLSSTLNKVDMTQRPENAHNIREEGQPSVNVHEYEDYDDDVEEEELHEEMDAELGSGDVEADEEDALHEEADSELKKASIVITAVDSPGMGKNRTKRFVRELNRPRSKKVYRYRVCVRPEWHRSVSGKYRWRSKCIRTDATGSSTVKLIYLGFDRGKRPTRMKIEGKNVPLVDVQRYEKMLADLRAKQEKGKERVKPPKAKVEPGKEVTPGGEPGKPGKLKVPPKGKKILDTSPEELKEIPKKKKPAKKPKKKKRRKTRPRKSPGAKAREKPHELPTPIAEIQNREIGKIARRSWMKDSVTELADVISRHPAILQTAATGIGVAAGIFHAVVTKEIPPDYIRGAQWAATGIGVAASLQSPDKSRILDHLTTEPTDYLEMMITDQTNQAFGIKHLSHVPTPLLVTEKLDHIDAAISAENIPYRVRGKAVGMVKSLDPQNPPALADIEELERMQRVGKMDEVAAVRQKVEAEEDPDKRKELESELDEKEHEIDVVKRRISFKIENWRLEKYDKFAFKKRQEKLQRSKRNMKMYILDLERKLLEIPPSDKGRLERTEERKRKAVRELNSPPHSEV